MYIDLVVIIVFLVIVFFDKNHSFIYIGEVYTEDFRQFIQAPASDR